MYPSELRPEVGTGGRLSFSISSGAGKYNEYPYGLSPAPLLNRLVGVAGKPVADRTRLIDKLLGRDIVFAVGTEDTKADYLDRSRSANSQGPNRYTRLKHFVDFLKTKYHSTSCRLLPIAGVGHNSQRLIRSPEIERVLLGSLNLANTEFTDTGLKHLKGLAQLRSLCLCGTKITNAAIERLRKALPNCTIQH